jgi:hypothetical protein
VELAGPHRREVGRGGGDEAGGDDVLAGPADPPEAAFLENAQELALRPGREDVDAVEVEGTAGGAFEEAGLARDGAGEGAAFVPEELAVEEVVGEGGEVDADERLVGPPGAGVQDAREPVLSAAGGTDEEDGGVGVEAREPFELGPRPRWRVAKSVRRSAPAPIGGREACVSSGASPQRRSSP